MTDQVLLDGRELAISISESSDMHALGFDEEHLVATMLEFARHTLLWRGTIAYGGDLRANGFTEHLIALTREVASARAGVVRSYLAWPLHLDLGGAREASLEPAVVFEKLAEVSGEVPDPSVTLPPTSAANQVLWSRNLTAMRRRMADAAVARIIIGGRTTGALGAVPGVVEEALLTLDRGRPLYLVGAFGGCARVVWEALNNRPAPELSITAQEAGNPGYAAFVESYNAWANAAGEPAIDYAAIRGRFADTGIAGLRNGLTASENERLATTADLGEMIALVSRGLHNVG